MVAGFDRYYQIATCFRDEDLRADRQFEFRQLDLELAFPTREDVSSVLEGAVGASFEALGRTPPDAAVPAADLARGDGALRLRQARPPLRPRDPGRDRGDARLGVRGLRAGAERPVPHRAAGVLARRARRLEEFAKEWGAKGLAYLVFDEEGEVRSPIAKFLSERELEAFRPGAGVDGALRRRRAADGRARARRAPPPPRRASSSSIDATPRRVPLGHRLPALRVGRGRQALDVRATTPSRACGRATRT